MLSGPSNMDATEGKLTSLFTRSNDIHYHFQTSKQGSTWATSKKPITGSKTTPKTTTTVPTTTTKQRNTQRPPSVTKKFKKPSPLPPTTNKPRKTTKRVSPKPTTTRKPVPTTKPPKITRTFSSGSTVFVTTTTEAGSGVICAENEFLCRSDQCINSTQVCDGVVDCSPLAEPTDETNCSCVERLSANLVCDGVHDCSDGSDEANCPFCAESNRCPNGRCLRNEDVCDGKRDCLEGTDEQSCTKLTDDLADEYGHIHVPAKSGYLMHRALDRWYPVCYRGRVRDRLSGLVREHKTVVDICSAYLGFGIPRVEFERRPLLDVSGSPPDFFLEYIGSSAQIVSTCISGILVHATCPDVQCPSEEADPVAEPPIAFLKASDAGEWPSNALLYMDGSVHCSATIIGSDLLVTSANCLDQQPPRSFFEIKVGSIRYRSASPFESVHRVSSVIVHEDYDARSLRNNIALVRIDSDIRFNVNVRPACLLSNISASTGDSCRILGLDDDRLWDTGISLNSSCDGSDLCGDLLDGGCDESVGGGLFCEVLDNRATSSWYLAGLVSRASDCRNRIAGRYVDVALYGDWIARYFDDGIGASTATSCPGLECHSLDGNRCVPAADLCDGTVHCRDAADELLCT